MPSEAVLKPSTLGALSDLGGTLELPNSRKIKEYIILLQHLLYEKTRWHPNFKTASKGITIDSV